jgi:hypothetical protein
MLEKLKAAESKIPIHIKKVSNNPFFYYTCLVEKNYFLRLMYVSSL